MLGGVLCVLLYCGGVVFVGRWSELSVARCTKCRFVACHAPAVRIVAGREDKVAVAAAGKDVVAVVAGRVVVVVDIGLGSKE